MVNRPLRITIEHLESFAIGAWIMGTGGGGEPYFSLLEARQHHWLYDAVNVLLGELMEDGCCRAGVPHEAVQVSNTFF